MVMRLRNHYGKRGWNPTDGTAKHALEFKPFPAEGCFPASLILDSFYSFHTAVFVVIAW